MLNFFFEKPYVNVYVRMLFICFFKCFGIFCFDFDKRKLYEYFQMFWDVFLFNFLIC